jgi:hypothetical protein
MSVALTKTKQLIIQGDLGAIESFSVTTHTDPSSGGTVDSALSEIMGVLVFPNTSGKAAALEATWSGNTITITGANAAPQQSCVCTVLVLGKL